MECSGYGRKQDFLIFGVNNNYRLKGSGCGSVGRAVASDTRDPVFESSHRRNFILNILIVNC